ncbi:zinc-dependent metalloprotease [Myceligenerans crystallogenes]|uniref:Zinc-dependent metalloprotease n=1 Tax=Myceligenerans crystallogenes TaxID=316335 RepID=A0ABN2N9S5_9MICO
MEPIAPVTSQPAVDWPAAARVAARLAAPGPVAPRQRLHDLVGGLREAAATAVGHVHDVTRMVPDGGPADVVVVDRASWARANTQSMATVIDGIEEATTAQDGFAGILPRGLGPAVQVAGAAEVGAVLALLSGRVLGQYDPYLPGGGAGRLLLVAPNVLQAETSMGVPVRDFRLWVCLHEQTHAWQFGVAPWLADHLRGRTHGLAVELTRTSAELARARLDRQIAVVGRAVLDALRGRGDTLVDGFLTPAQKDSLADLTAVMALLEGHADVMMDAVGPSVVPSVKRIRARFERRRDGADKPAFDVVVRRLLGMDAKLAQYRDGAAFVRAVERTVGRDGLNAVWTGPDTLPDAREIQDPRAWIRRVHG